MSQEINMSTTEELSKIGKGITLLVTRVPKRGYALVRFEMKNTFDEPSDEEKAAIQFANACLPEPVEGFKRPSNVLLVPLESVAFYKRFGFRLKSVPLPS